MRAALRSLVSLNEGAWRWASAFEAAIAMGLPIALFMLAGRQPDGFIASLGGFTVLYCSARSRSGRLRLLPLVALGLCLAAALGTAFAFNAWLSALALVVIATLASVLTLGMKIGPPGPLIFVLIAAVSAHLAAPPALGGIAMNPVLIPILIAIGGLVAYLVVLVPLLLPSVREKEKGKPGDWAPHLQFDEESTAISIRVVAGVLGAMLFRQFVGDFPPSYWVVITTVAVLQAARDRHLTTARAVQRMVGTILGVGAFWLIAHLEPRGVWLLVIVVVLRFASQVVIVRNYALALFFITPLALTLYTAGRSGDPLVTMGGRVADTLLGSAIAMVVFWASEWIRNRVTREARS